MAKITSNSSSQGFRGDKIAGNSNATSGSDIQNLNSLINSILAGNAGTQTPGNSSPKVG